MKEHSLDWLFCALAEPTRLRLLNVIDGREVCVCYFVEILRIGQPKISRHLAYLRGAGLVESRREGKWMHYRLGTPASPAAAAILRETLKALKKDTRMKKDLARLETAYCQPEKFVALRGAVAGGLRVRA